MEEKYRADTAVANSQREFDMRKAGFQEEVNQKVWCGMVWYVIRV